MDYVRTLVFVAAAVLAASCAGGTKEGERCGSNEDCGSDELSCLDGFCVKPGSKDLYQACIVDGECQSSACAAGYCSMTCSQFVNAGRYRIGDCVDNIDISTCARQGVGCCLLTSVQSSTVSQDDVQGFCTATP